MGRKRILFLSYLYPPAGGVVLPGVQRSVKFVRNIKSMDVFVLAPRPEFYADFIAQNQENTLPVQNETIIYTGVFEVFNFFLSIKNRLLPGEKKEKKIANEESRSGSVQFQDENCRSTRSGSRRSYFQRVKDGISGVLTYPDVANHWIYPAIKEGRKVVRENEIDYIFATGKPWSALIAAYYIHKFGSGKVKLIVDFRDPWVNNPFAENEGFLQQVTDKYFEKKIVKRSDIIFLNTEALTREFVARYPKEPTQKFITLPNGFDIHDFSFLPSEKYMNPDEKQVLTITHAGLLYGLRDPISIFKATALLKKKDNNLSRRIQVRQVGEITLDYDFSNFIRQECDQENFINYGQLPYRDCISHLAESDILLIIQPDTKTQIPSKLYEYIYLNKAILTIAPKNGALGELIETYELGEIFEPGDVEGIAEYLERKILEKTEKGFLHVDYENRNLFDTRKITEKMENVLLGLG